MVSVAVVILDLFERPAIDDSLITLQARALFALVSDDGKGAKFDALDGTPRLGLASGNLDAVKACLFKCLQELIPVLLSLE